MSFRDLLQLEIQTQGISVADVAKVSGISKGAIYNILNGSTEDDRIRPSTRHALARGCGRALEVAPDGTHRFVSADSPLPEPGVTTGPGPFASLKVEFTPARPFRPNSHVADILNWLNELEEQGSLTGMDVVDRVYQKRSDFLSLLIENDAGDDLKTVEIPISVAYDDGPNKTFSCRFSHLSSGDRAEMTVHVASGPPYTVFLQDGQAVTAANDRVSISTQATYRHRG